MTEMTRKPSWVRRVLIGTVIAATAAIALPVAAGASAAPPAQPDVTSPPATQPIVTASSTPAGPGAVRASATTTSPVPALGHVFTIVLENATYEEVTSPSGQALMPYLTSLEARGVMLDQMYGASHLSLTNYIAMTSGNPPNALTQADCLFYNCVYGPPADENIADQLEAAGDTWKGYMDAMPTPCAHGVEGQLDPYLGLGAEGGYATRHNPFMYYRDIVSNPARCDAHDVPYTELAGDLANGTTPNYSLIAPDTCDDAHNRGADCNLDAADRWLAANVPQILASRAFADRGVLVITFDESDVTDVRGCCGDAAGGRIFTLVLSPFVASPGSHSSTPYSHYSLLRTWEDGFGLPCLGAACDAGSTPLGSEVLSSSLHYTSTYTAGEAAALDRTASTLHTTPSGVQKLGVDLLALVSLLAPRSVAVPAPPLSGPVGVTSTWSSDYRVLQRVEQQFELGPEAAQKLGAQLVVFLVSLAR